MITREQLAVGTKFKIVDDEDGNIWTVCNNPDVPESGQFTTWGSKPAVYATTPARWPEAVGEGLLNDGIVLFSEVEEILN